MTAKVGKPESAAVGEQVYKLVPATGRERLQWAGPNVTAKVGKPESAAVGEQVYKLVSVAGRGKNCGPGQA